MAKNPKGSVEILNTEEGHHVLKFDTNDPEAMEKARITVEDMLKRGYFLTVRVGDQDHRVTKFDPATDTYTIKDVPPETSRVKATEHVATAIAPAAGG